MPEQKRLARVSRATKPFLGFHARGGQSTQPCSKTIHSVQRRLTRYLLADKPRPDEALQSFVRMHTRRASDAATKHGTWNRFVCQRVLTWKAHLERPRNMYSWPARLLPWRGQEFLMQRRAQFPDRGALGGRTGTRTSSGHVHTRWQDGATNAEAWLSASEAGVGRSERRKGSQKREARGLVQS